MGCYWHMEPAHGAAQACAAAAARGLLGPVVLAGCPARPPPALSRPWGIGIGGLTEPAAVSAAVGPVCCRRGAAPARPGRREQRRRCHKPGFPARLSPRGGRGCRLEPPGCRRPGAPSPGGSSGGARARPGRRETPVHPAAGPEPAPGPTVSALEDGRARKVPMARFVCRENVRIC